MKTPRSIHTFQAASDVAADLMEFQQRHPRRLGRAINECLRRHVAMGAGPELYPVTRGPLPERVRAGSNTRYPWHLMLGEGDSFFVPNGSPTSIRSCIRNQCARRLRGARFTIRSVVENGQAGCRVYRLK